MSDVQYTVTSYPNPMCSFFTCLIIPFVQKLSVWYNSICIICALEAIYRKNHRTNQCSFLFLLSSLSLFFLRINTFITWGMTDLTFQAFSFLSCNSSFLNSGTQLCVWLLWPGSDATHVSSLPYWNCSSRRLPLALASVVLSSYFFLAFLHHCFSFKCLPSWEISWDLF